MDEKDCIFCKIANKQIPSKIVFENDKIVAFEDLKPQAPVHILIIPKTHIAKVADAADSDVELLGRLVVAAKDIAVKKGIGSSGYRVVINCNKDAGQEVFHLHLHLLGGRKFTWPPG